jgi:hypothetical protein|tara:strand:- start:1431 stop:1889 length:459 start_codon:yes stop_codon:yes gene_type:complete
MDNIENLFTISLNKYNDDFYILKFVYNKHEITDLRILKFIKNSENAINALKNDKIKNVNLIFVLKDMIIPTNFSFIKEFINIINKNSEIMINKVGFTIIENEDNLFKIFINIFKQYYKPYKSLYLCKNHEETEMCLNDEESRNKFPNITKLL